MARIPHDLTGRLQHLLLATRHPAFARVSADGLLREWGGEWDRYGYVGMERGQSAVAQVAVLEGLLPLKGKQALLPMVAMGAGRCADVYGIPGAGDDWIVLLDATEAAADRQRIQQAMNTAALLHQRERKLLRQIRRDGEDMAAILDHMRILAAVVDAGGCVGFINRTGRELLACGLPEIAGRDWERVFPLDEEGRSALRELLATPGNGQRRTLRLSTPGGRFLWLECEVQSDPRDRHGRLVYGYDISDACALREKLRASAEFEGMIGRSKGMEGVFQMIRTLAPLDATVLIEGETGTGKENVARAIHFTSRRREQAFIPVNCAGLSDSLINSELFGHRKGAFTGADQDQEGLFEASSGGTIMLDEIGDIPMNTQTRILRVLEEREVVRIGETRPRRIDIRVLAATNKDLAAEVRAGRFRKDLLYRIRVARVAIPPLRERREDIPLLADHFLVAACAAMHKTVRGIAPDALRRLLDYAWPGNVRELRNAVDFAVIGCRGAVLQAADLPPEIVEAPARAASVSRAGALPEEKRRILEALQAEDGNREKAAARLGISRATLYRRMKVCL